MGRMRLGPALQRGQALPPTHAEALVGGMPCCIEHRHVAVGEAADRPAVVAQVVHASAQHRLDILEIDAPLFGLRSRPVLARADQAQVLLRHHPLVQPVRQHRRRICRSQVVVLRHRKPVPHAAPVGMLLDRLAQPGRDARNPFRRAGGKKRLEPLDGRLQHLGESADGLASESASRPCGTVTSKPLRIGAGIVPVAGGHHIDIARGIQVPRTFPVAGALFLLQCRSDAAQGGVCRRGGGVLGVLHTEVRHDHLPGGSRVTGDTRRIRGLVVGRSPARLGAGALQMRGDCGIHRGLQVRVHQRDATEGVSRTGSAATVPGIW